jgi:hypothetical protein
MSASHVLICLGDDPEELTFNATDTIRILAGDVRGLLEEHGSWESLPEVQWSEVDNWEGLKWSALARLSRKEWFKRVWVWQEVGLAKNATILYGDSEADWDDLMTVFKWLTHRAEELEELYDLEVSETNELWSSYDLENRDYIYPNDGHRSLENFIELLEKTRDLKASDPRDKLYAFLGHPLLDLVIKPNYELPVWKVYAQFVQAWVNRFRCLQILSMAGTSKVVTKSEVMTTAYFDFPTWCPRWNEPSDTRWPFYGYGFNTGTYRECEVSIVYEGVLILQGAKFDSVKTVKPQIDFPDTPYLIQRDSGAPGIYSALDISLEIRGTFTSSDGIWSKKGLVSTLVGGYQYGDELTAVCESFENYISQLRAKGRDVYEKLDDVIDGVRGNVNGDAEVFLSNATAACSGRRFFMTERGYYGLGPDGMEAGDICVIFFGGEVPFILRPSAEFYYYLVGECYVHGIMHGEVRRIVEKEELFHLL